MQTSAASEKKLIALTFDDGPGAYTEQLLDGLKQRGARATFFIVGQCVGGREKTVRRAFDEGHQIAQHTYDHPQLSKCDNDKIAWELNKTTQKLYDAVGMEFRMMLRPPYGDYNDRVMQQIRMPAIMWSIDPIDWRDRNSDTVRDRIVNAAFDGAIVLSHDIHKTTVPGVLAAIDILQKQGYEFVTVNELHRRRGATLRDGERYYSCKPTGTENGRTQEPKITSTAVYGGFDVTLSAQSGAKIYYSLDGSAPRTLYTGKITLTAGQTLTAFAAYDINGDRSATVTKTTDHPALEAVRLSVKDGCFVLENPNAKTDLRYTTDGTKPTASSPKYTSPIACYDGTLSYCVMGDGVVSDVYSYTCTKRGNLFLDVAPNLWYFASIDWASTKGILKGTEPYRYEPDGSLTRAMFVTMLHRLMEGKQLAQKTQNVKLSDVNSAEWYAKAVTWAVENGVVNGYEDGTFRPSNRITREEMCVILDRLLQTLNKQGTAATLTFADRTSIADWARDAVARLTATGIIRGQGENRFAPKSTATRAEAATVMLRLLEHIEK